MDEIKIGDQVVRHDRELTIRAYSSMDRGGAEECGCTYCRNFAAQRKAAYPEGTLRLFETLGIDFNKEGEVYEIYSKDGSTHYGGWLFFAGVLVVGGDYLTKESGTDFEFHFVEGKNLPKPSVDFGEGVLAIDFTTTIPWILAEEP